MQPNLQMRDVTDSIPCISCHSKLVLYIDSNIFGLDTSARAYSLGKIVLTSITGSSETDVLLDFAPALRRSTAASWSCFLTVKDLNSAGFTVLYSVE